MLSIALAGKPNAGKSTFYAAATRSSVEMANYPFTTIDPNRGMSHVRTDCPCLDRTARCGDEHCHDGKRYVPVELIDVAGLVPGAHEGRGLGNQFLDELTNADVILNVVDASGATNAEGEPVEIGEHDPLEDVSFIEEELNRWLASIIERNFETVERQSRSPNFDLEDALYSLFDGIGIAEPTVTAGLRSIEYPSNPAEWDESTHLALAAQLRRRSLPIVLVANKVDEAPRETVEALLDHDSTVIPATAQGELALRRGVENDLVAYDPGDESFELLGDVSDAQKSILDELAETMAEWGGTGVQTALDHAAYDCLDQITAFPVQDDTAWTDGQDNVLPDAVLLPQGATSRDLAAAVHTDIAEGYLHAVDARANRQISDEQELEEGDVVKIVSTAS